MSGDPCIPIHRILAGHVLHAVNLGYDMVTATHLRLHSADDHWEAEIVCDDAGVSYVSRSACPLEAALEVAAEIIEIAEAMREHTSAELLH